MVVGFEDDMEIRCAGEEFVVVGGDQRARRISGRSPVYQSVRSSISSQSRCADTVASVGASMRMNSPSRSSIDLVVEEVDRRGCSSVRSKPGVRSLDAATMTSVGDALNSVSAFVERRAATPALDQPGIPGLGQRSVARSPSRSSTVSSSSQLIWVLASGTSKPSARIRLCACRTRAPPRHPSRRGTG